MISFIVGPPSRSNDAHGDSPEASKLKIVSCIVINYASFDEFPLFHLVDVEFYEGMKNKKGILHSLEYYSGIALR
jgi:hypothetical protein